METITKLTREVGTSAGVLLPRNWLNKPVRVTLLDISLEDILKKIISILYKNNLLKDVLGIYLTGSYARGDHSNESDIDILIITHDTNKTIGTERYNLTLISENQLKKQLKDNLLYIYPMIAEAKTLMNQDLINSYKKINLNKKDISLYLKSTKKMLKKSEEMIVLDKKLNNSKTGDDVAYSLILRLRGLYILECLMKNKKWNKKDLLNLVNNINAKQIYKRYLYSRDNRVVLNNTILIKDAEKLIPYIKEKIKKIENG